MRQVFFSCALILAGTSACAQGVAQGPKNAPELSSLWPTQTRAPPLGSGVSLVVEVLADGLETPWGIGVLPEGGYLVTERTGALRVVREGTVGPPITGLPDILVDGQGGLLDVALAPDFAQSRVIYFTYAKPMEGDTSATAAARAVLSDDEMQLLDVRDIFLQDPPSPNAIHFGSRVVPHDGYLFITTGEHFTQTDRQFAQDTGKTYGKVVRVLPQGGAVPGNPFDNEVWSYGHRNVQGADVRPSTGELWTLEHGPRGGDELNLIERGANYGWPVVSYGVNYSGAPVGSGMARAQGFTEPRYYWDPVIAPGGFVFYEGEMFPDWQGDVLAASLNPGGLVRLRLEGDRVSGEERFFADEIRVRDVEIDRDGAILILDNTDGRLLRLTPQ